ncbi:hypothetical protein CR513_56913, partial [Mucuna pruriens]
MKGDLILGRTLKGTTTNKLTPNWEGPFMVREEVRESIQIGTSRWKISVSYLEYNYFEKILQLNTPSYLREAIGLGGLRRGYPLLLQWLELGIQDVLDMFRFFRLSITIKIFLNIVKRRGQFRLPSGDFLIVSASSLLRASKHPNFLSIARESTKEYST